MKAIAMILAFLTLGATWLYGWSLREEGLIEYQASLVTFAKDHDLTVQGVQRYACVVGKLHYVVRESIISSSVLAYEPSVECNDSAVKSVNQAGMDKFVNGNGMVMVSVVAIFGLIVMLIASIARTEEKTVIAEG